MQFGGHPENIAARGLYAATRTPAPIVPGFPSLGRYQLLSRLAVGGMAEVYLARYGEITGFKTLVVVKKVLPHLAVKPDFIAMFLDEARIATLLDHPNVVRINEVGRTDQEYFLAMELVQGKPLASLLHRVEKSKEALPQKLAALIVANAAAGLHYAHQLTDASGTLLGLVHRDVSPQNIMISFEGSVKVIDFGIARALGRLNETNSGSLKGKLGYVAPEQTRGGTTDARADIFSLGVVLWESLVGSRLFRRENELATLHAVVYEPIPPISKFVEVDPSLESIATRALQRNLDDRYQSAEEMRIDLERWIFASGGTSTHEMSALMKAWFPHDYSHWQHAAKIALDMQASDGSTLAAFPDLQEHRSSRPKPDTGRSGASPTVPNARRENSSHGRDALALLHTLGAHLRSRSRIRLIAGATAIVLLAVLLEVTLFSRKNHTQNPLTETMPVAPILPTVETPSTREGSTGKSAGAPTQVAETPRSSERESTGSGKEDATRSRRSRGSTSEKRATHPRQTKSGHALKARPNPFN